MRRHASDLDARPSAFGIGRCSLFGVALRCGPVLGELLKVVDQAVELPLPVHFRSPARREAIEAFIVAHVRKHRLYLRKALPVACLARRRIDPLFHAGRVCRRFCHHGAAVLPRKNETVRTVLVDGARRQCARSVQGDAVVLLPLKAFPDSVPPH